MQDKKTKPKFNKGVFKRLFAMIFERYALACAVVFVCIVAAAAAQIKGSLFLQTLIDDFIMPQMGAAAPDFGPLAAALLQVGGIYLVGVVCAFLYIRIMVYVAQGTLRDVRVRLFSHMQRLPVRYFDQNSHGDIMSVYTNDTDSMHQFISQSMPQLCSSIITVVGVFFGMLRLNVWLTGITLLVLLVSLWATRFITSRSRRYFAAQQKDLGAVNGYIEEMMSGQKVVKVFSHEPMVTQQFENLSENLRSSAENASKFGNILMPVNGQLGNLSYVLCAIGGSVLALSGYGGLTIGMLISFMTLNKNFTQPISQISNQLNSVVMALAGAERIFALLDQTEEADEGTVTLVNVTEAADGTLTETTQRTGVWGWKYPRKNGEIDYIKLEGAVVMDHVDFGYVPEKPVLHEVDLYATKGQKIAFIGSTGAGKTTITNLINRFYDIQDGKIRYDGININRIKKDDLRRSLGIVLQDVHLFTGTVLENIRYGRLDATDEECVAAAKLANAHGFIKRLPDGYQSILTGDGGNLSQGQRQLIAIARAAVADPPVLILDEATSSIDTRTERLVQKGMDGLMQGRTSFVIAHRLSTVQNADCIMVLEAGRIIERGSHTELMAKKGRYHQLYSGGED